MLLQMILDSRALLESGHAAELDGITRGINGLGRHGSSSGGNDHTDKKKPTRKPASANGDVEEGGAAFAQRIGVVFRYDTVKNKL